MNWLDMFKLIMGFLPCIFALFKGLNEAKADDGKISFDEVIKIAETFFNCITGKMSAHAVAIEVSIKKK